jgi:hypothetical protein
MDYGTDDRDTCTSKTKFFRGQVPQLVARLVTTSRHNLVNDEEMTSDWIPLGWNQLPVIPSGYKS